NLKRLPAKISNAPPTDHSANVSHLNRMLMKTSDLVFVGIKGSVIALNRCTGEKVWTTRLKGWDFVNVLIEDNAVLASCSGEVFCLEPLTGKALWHNPLKGFGTGLTTIATTQSPANGNASAHAEK